jgi:hypothetical protein
MKSAHVVNKGTQAESGHSQQRFAPAFPFVNPNG